jgi:hypothetical protein
VVIIARSSAARASSKELAEAFARAAQQLKKKVER